MNQALTSIKARLPLIIGIAIVVVSALQDQGVIHLSDNAITVINAVLAAFGLGVLHVRQQAQLRAAREAGQRV